MELREIFKKYGVNYSYIDGYVVSQFYALDKKTQKCLLSELEKYVDDIIKNKHKEEGKRKSKKEVNPLKVRYDDSMSGLRSLKHLIGEFRYVVKTDKKTMAVLSDGKIGGKSKLKNVKFEDRNPLSLSKEDMIIGRGKDQEEASVVSYFDYDKNDEMSNEVDYYLNSRKWPTYKARVIVTDEKNKILGDDIQISEEDKASIVSKYDTFLNVIDSLTDPYAQVLIRYNKNGYIEEVKPATEKDVTIDFESRKPFGIR